MLSRCASARPRQIPTATSIRSILARTVPGCGVQACRQGGLISNHPFQIQSASYLSSLSTTIERRPRWASAWSWPPVIISSSEEPRASTSPLFQHQVRWKRKGGASAFSEPRPPTRKHRKAYNRRMKKQHYDKVGKHSPPGSKMVIRRQMAQDKWQELLDRNKPEEEIERKPVEYNFGDALLDDIMGNTSEYTSTPTPKPKYLGNRHSFFYNTVAQQMETYKLLRSRLEEAGSPPSSIDELSIESLPTDESISLVIRAYRDRHGTKHKPIGIVKALKHLVTDLSLPTSSFGENTYTSLLTCCRTPNEARRIFRLMKDNQYPISSFSWSILVDIHAKSGDFEGCDNVMKEMVTEGVPPTVHAYTSLLAACYKVCNAGNISHSIRADAGNLAWARWKEMNIIGIEPDVKAFGAFLRICAARGRPEQAINILEEMQIKGVKPTTLCFTSALRAVARSHETSIRYERGHSKTNYRREQITFHHGKLARQAVILAENAEVDQDDGFVAALMMCAAAAGDSATAKAILIASDVRRMDHLRTIGSDSHLRRLQGFSLPDDLKLALAESLGANQLTEFSNQLSASSGGELETLSDRKPSRQLPSFEEREYGKDTRKLSALLHACSQAAESNGIGSMWAGRGNKGYLCENSLRQLTIRPQPEYRDNSVPGIGTKGALNNIIWDDEPEVMGKRLRRAPFRGSIDDDLLGHTMDDMDDELFNLFKPKEEKSHSEEFDSEDNLPNFGQDMDQSMVDIIEGRGARYFQAQSSSIQSKSTNERTTVIEPPLKETDEEWYFDDDSMKWKVKMPQSNDVAVSSNRETMIGEIIDTQTIMAETTADVELEHYFDEDLMRWQTRPKMSKSAITAFEAKSLARTTNANETDNGHTERGSDTAGLMVAEADFQRFYQELKEEVIESGEGIDFDEEEARELFAMVKDDFLANDETMVEDDEGDDVNDEDDNDEDEGDEDDFHDASDFGDKDFETLFQKAKEGWIGQDFEIDKAKAQDMYNAVLNEGDVDESRDNHVHSTMDTPRIAYEASLIDTPSHHSSKSSPASAATEYASSMRSVDSMSHSIVEYSEESAVSSIDDDPTGALTELQAALPGLPLSRIKKVNKAFQMSLGPPSMLRLVPALRENMPENVSSGWLKQKNLQNAEFVMEKAEAEDLIDVHLLTGILQVKTSTGSLDSALAYHEEEFGERGIVPTAYSDRLVLQMLVRNHRLPRALAFKQKVEESGRTLDILSYGSMIDYYSKRRHLGSALMLLKECISVNGAPPVEHCLSSLRLLCRQNEVEKHVGLHDLIGKDPVEWIRHGETNLKREMSYKGKRDVILARNRTLQI